jgi:hypothetical protein
MSDKCTILQFGGMEGAKRVCTGMYNQHFLLMIDRSKVAERGCVMYLILKKNHWNGMDLKANVEICL